MKTSVLQYSVDHPKEFLQQVLCLANGYGTFAFLDHAYPGAGKGEFDWMLGLAPMNTVQSDAQNPLPDLQPIRNVNDRWWFGHVSFPASEQTPQEKPVVMFPSASFFTPGILLQCRGSECSITCFNGGRPEDILKEILLQPVWCDSMNITVTNIRQDTGRTRYLDDIASVMQHIQYGDCYELNYCMEFHANECELDPVALYIRLREYSPNPFSALYRLRDAYCLCASPERFFRLSSGKLMSQPIKGTARRIHGDAGLDSRVAESLRMSEKERAENVMVVDLVRNDLSKICDAGSVEVPELCGVYAFPQVHQMISTVEGRLQTGKDWLDVMHALFPMGSMTGAPKKKVLELIHQYEKRERGLFSGTIGYISPDGTADFNVVIRSLMYDASEGQISFSAGSGITAYCHPEDEYEECLLKTVSWQKLFGSVP